MKVIQFIIIACLTAGMALNAVSQNIQVLLSFSLDTIDCNAGQACFNAQLSTATPGGPFEVEGMTVRFIYDGSWATNATISSADALYTATEISEVSEMIAGAGQDAFDFQGEAIFFDGNFRALERTSLRSLSEIPATFFKVCLDLKEGYGSVENQCLPLLWDQESNLTGAGSFDQQSEGVEVSIAGESLLGDERVTHFGWEYGNGTGAFGGPVQESGCDFCYQTLPIELLNFRAQKSGSHVQLEWTTASELHSDFFEVQASNDGEDFKVLGKIKAAGTSTKLSRYSFLDKTPFKGMNYYRIRMVETDASAQFSPIATVMFSENAQDQLHVFPNPVREFATVTFTTQATAERVEIDLLNQLGIEVVSNLVDQEFLQGSHAQRIDFTKIPSGIYIVRASFADRVETYSIEVLN